MAGWDDDGPRLCGNLEQVLNGIRDDVRQSGWLPAVESARQWQRDTMAGLDAPHPDYVGGFRGERGELADCDVWVGTAPGVPAAEVAGELQRFERRLRQAVQEMDRAFAQGSRLNADGLTAVLELAAWAHTEWVRIHPFANGNGRTARLWANALLMRYGLPPVIRLRPRPDAPYGDASGKAMQGDWQPTAAVFRAILLDRLRSG